MNESDAAARREDDLRMSFSYTAEKSVSETMIEDAIATGKGLIGIDFQFVNRPFFKLLSPI